MVSQSPATAPPDPVRLGIIGLGNMGAVHARSILDGKVPGLDLVAVADRDAERLAPFPEVARFDDALALIGSGSVDAILIATPHYSHTTLGIAALEAGLHVLVEKPISVHKQDCEPSSPPPARLGQGLRRDVQSAHRPALPQAQQLIDDGTLGTVRRINWIITDWFRTEHYYGSGDWRATWGGEGGGVLLNQCPHNLDVWQWCFGLPERVTAHCQIGRFHDIEVEDSVTALLEYPSGVQGVFVTTTGEAPGTNRLEVVADNGKIVISNDQPGIQFTRNEVPAAQFSKDSASGFAKPETWEITIPIHAKGEQHVGILKNFTAAIQGTEPLIAPAVEGIHSVELANAMLLSSFRDRPISLPLDAADYAAELKKKDR